MIHEILFYAGAVAIGALLGAVGVIWWAGPMVDEDLQKSFEVKR